MEAIALYDFAARTKDELSFKEGCTLNVLLKGEYWYKAEELQIGEAFLSLVLHLDIGVMCHTSVHWG